MTDKNKALKSSTRREFFKKAGLGTAVAAGAAAGLGAEPAPAAAKTTTPEGQGYRETAHIKRFYELANKY